MPATRQSCSVRRGRTMDPESVRGRLILSVVDKLLIGVAATIVVAFIQVNQQRAAVLEEQRLAVSRVVTGVLSEQQAQLMVDVSKFLVLVDRLRPAGRALEANAVQLGELEVQIRGAVAVIATIQAARPKPGKCEPGSDAGDSGEEEGEAGRGVLGEFTAAIGTLTERLFSHGIQPDDLQARSDAVRSKYVDVLTFLRCLNVDTVSQEVFEVSDGHRG